MRAPGTEVRFPVLQSDRTGYVRRSNSGLCVIPVSSQGTRLECQAALRRAPVRRFRALQKPGSGQSAWTVRFSTSVRGNGCHLDGASDQKDPDRSCRKRSFPLRRAGRQKDIQMSYLVTDSVSPSFGESPALCVRREVPCERSSGSD